MCVRVCVYPGTGLLSVHGRGSITAALTMAREEETQHEMLQSTSRTYLTMLTYMPNKHEHHGEDDLQLTQQRGKQREQRPLRQARRPGEWSVTRRRPAMSPSLIEPPAP